MDRKTYLWVAGIIFTLVALFHLLRIFEDWPVIIGDWSIQKWVSWVALIVAGGSGFQFDYALGTDLPSAVPGPIVGAGLPCLLFASGGLLG